MSHHPFSDKHVRMYMRQAKSMAHPEHNSCLSRAIGVVVVKNDVPGGRIVSSGYNGPAAHMPPPDSYDHLLNVVLPQLSDQEYRDLHEKAVANAVAKGDIQGTKPLTDAEVAGRDHCRFVAFQNAGCGQCPRRLVGVPSRKRLELCNCAHAEENAITRAVENLSGHDCTMFCWCGVPCGECCRKILNAGIQHLVVIDWGFAYSKHSLWMLHRGGISVEVRDPETLKRVNLSKLKEGAA